MLPRLLLRLVLILVAYAVIRRSLIGVGLPNRPGSRGAFLPWLGVLIGFALVTLVLRSFGIRL